MPRSLWLFNATRLKSLHGGKLKFPWRDKRMSIKATGINKRKKGCHRLQASQYGKAWCPFTLVQCENILTKILFERAHTQVRIWCILTNTEKYFNDCTQCGNWAATMWYIEFPKHRFLIRLKENNDEHLALLQNTPKTMAGTKRSTDVKIVRVDEVNAAPKPA